MSKWKPHDIGLSRGVIDIIRLHPSSPFMGLSQMSIPFKSIWYPLKNTGQCLNCKKVFLWGGPNNLWQRSEAPNPQDNPVQPANPNLVDPALRAFARVFAVPNSPFHDTTSRARKSKDLANSKWHPTYRKNDDPVQRCSRTRQLMHQQTVHQCNRNNQESPEKGQDIYSNLEKAQQEAIPTILRLGDSPRATDAVLGRTIRRRFIWENTGYSITEGRPWVPDPV